MWIHPRALHSSRLQRLIHWAQQKATCSSSIYDAHIVHEMQHITLTDLDLKQEDIEHCANQDTFPQASARCMTLFHDSQLTLCAFFLEPLHWIPLHDHPNMTVFSRVIEGLIHITSYDWLENPKRSNLAKLIRDEDVSSTTTSVGILYPTSHGNLHELRALRRSVILDLLIPPYSARNHRNCTYYKVIHSKTPSSTYCLAVDTTTSFLCQEEETLL
jgi:hypothetical protein